MLLRTERGPQLRRFAVVCGSLQAWGVASRCIVDVVDVALPCYRLPLRTSPPPVPQQSEGIRLPDRRVRVVGSRVVQGGLSRRNPGTRGRCRAARTGSLALAPASCRNKGTASRHHKGAASYRHKGTASRPSRARHRATAKARQKFVSPCVPPLCATAQGAGRMLPRTGRSPPQRRLKIGSFRPWGRTRRAASWMW